MKPTKAQELEEARLKRVAEIKDWAKKNRVDYPMAARWFDALPEVWEGRARMARTRKGLGLDLDRIDEIALAR